MLLELRLLLAVCLSAVCILLDQHFDYSSKVRLGLSYISGPAHYLVALPGEWASDSQIYFATREQLIESTVEQQKKLLVLETKLQRMKALEVENQRLRALLGSSLPVARQLLVAKILRLDSNPFSFTLTINKGIHHGVYVGQPVLDSQGVMGQVIEVGAVTSQIMLINDAAHAVPVQLDRTGQRVVAAGTGVPNLIEIKHIPQTADIREGDLLITSGLGERFPSGYPVGIISSIERVKGQTFAKIYAKPSAHLERNQHVLLVWPYSGNQNEP